MSSKNYCAHREPLSSGFCPDCECDVSIWETMSDTPRADAEWHSVKDFAFQHQRTEAMYEYAQKLERELSSSQKECTELRNVLGDAKVKLALYRMNHSGEYIGGVEYMELMNRIDAALAI